MSNITGWNYAYENAGQARGLKLTSSLYNGSGFSWNLDHTENYGYEAQRAFLTSAAYADGQTNPNQSWSYNESQNRNDSTTNDLNQLVIGGVCQTDLAGRLQSRNSATLSWDCVSRLTGYASGGVTDTYEYRADGMRDHRHLPGATTVDWSYYHDGQTTAEDEQISTPSNGLTVTRYGLGARGIDECERQTGSVSGGTHTLSSGTSVWYPICDGHGNQCGTLSRSGNNSFSLQNVRTFDAWGNVRRGATTGDPASRHCGSIGHVQDDESGLLYMRARFYDPSFGRFASEDQALSGSNLYGYCGNDPLNRFDESGKWTNNTDPNSKMWGCFWEGMCLAVSIGACWIADPAVRIAALMLAVGCAAMALGSAATLTNTEVQIFGLPGILLAVISFAVVGIPALQGLSNFNSIVTGLIVSYDAALFAAAAFAILGT